MTVLVAVLAAGAVAVALPPVPRLPRSVGPTVRRDDRAPLDRWRLPLAVLTGAGVGVFLDGAAGVAAGRAGGRARLAGPRPGREPRRGPPAGGPGTRPAGGGRPPGRGVRRGCRARARPGAGGRRARRAGLRRARGPPPAARPGGRPRERVGRAGGAPPAGAARACARARPRHGRVGHHRRCAARPGAPGARPAPRSSLVLAVSPRGRRHRSACASSRRSCCSGSCPSSPGSSARWGSSGERPAGHHLSTATRSPAVVHHGPRPRGSGSRRRERSVLQGENPRGAVLRAGDNKEST